MVGLAGGTRREMTEGRTYDVGAHHSLPATTLMSDGVTFNFPESPFDGLGVRPDQAAVAADERLNAYGFRRTKDAVPPAACCP